jgi:hypothetical protein
MSYDTHVKPVVLNWAFGFIWPVIALTATETAGFLPD